MEARELGVTNAVVASPENNVFVTVLPNRYGLRRWQQTLRMVNIIAHHGYIFRVSAALGHTFQHG